MTTTESSLRREIARLREKVDRQETALAFYRGSDTWRERELVWTDDEGQRVAGTASPAMLDRGKRAREAG